jgi:PBP1b-binding outer membrane lipoprotein LpoB
MKKLGFTLLLFGFLSGCAPEKVVIKEPPPVVVQAGMSVWVIRRVPTMTPAPSFQRLSPGVMRDAVVVMLCNPEEPPVCRTASVVGTWEDAVWPYMKSVK